jgi:hypothetical protein
MSRVTDPRKSLLEAESELVDFSPLVASAAVSHCPAPEVWFYEQDPLVKTKTIGLIIGIGQSRLFHCQEGTIHFATRPPGGKLSVTLVEEGIVEVVSESASNMELRARACGRAHIRAEYVAPDSQTANADLTVIVYEGLAPSRANVQFV